MVYYRGIRSFAGLPKSWLHLGHWSPVEIYRVGRTDSYPFSSILGLCCITVQAESADEATRAARVDAAQRTVEVPPLMAAVFVEPR